MTSQTEHVNLLADSARQEVAKVLGRWDPSFFILEERLGNAARPEEVDSTLKSRLATARALVAEAAKILRNAEEVLNGR